MKATEARGARERERELAAALDTRCIDEWGEIIECTKQRRMR